MMQIAGGGGGRGSCSLRHYDEMRTKKIEIEEKDKVMVNSYAMFQIREAVGRSKMFFKIGVLKNLEISQENTCGGVSF